MANQTVKEDQGLAPMLHAYDAFLEATLRLQQALENDEPAAVERLLACREGLMRDIDGMNRLIGRRNRGGQGVRGGAPAGPGEKLPAQILKRLHQIIAANQACDAVAARRCEETRQELTALRQAAKGFQGYGQRPGQLPKFLDVQT